jgi:predicted aspartyl protease
MPAYDRQRFSPPAAVASVRVVSLETSGSEDGVPMLIDTGADVSVLPKHVSDVLALPTADPAFELMAFDNTVSACATVLAAIVFQGRRYRGKYVVIDQEYGVLGRDILNHVALILDGPNLQWASR